MSKQFDIAFKTTSWFETGDQMFTTVVGNFDGQGLSFGPRQNNFGQGTLQPLLKKVEILNPQILINCFGSSLVATLKLILSAATIDEQTRLAIENMNINNRIKPEWRQAFIALGNQAVMQEVFIADAVAMEPVAEELAVWISTTGNVPKTIRLFCLAYDIVTQNGSISPALRLLLSTIRPLVAPFKRDANDWLQFVCWARAMWTDFRGNAEFSQNVLARKLLILRGHGKMGGEYVDLDNKFNITDEIY